MVEYKGFNIPESQDEFRNLIKQNSCAILAEPNALVISDEGGLITFSIIINKSRFSVPLSYEDFRTLPFESIDQTIKSLIDCAVTCVNKQDK